MPGAARASAYARYETFLQLGWIGGAAMGSILELSVTSGSDVVAGIALDGLAAGHVVGTSRCVRWARLRCQRCSGLRHP
ncbi:MAG: hypothetical protein M3503_07840 [Actinomycetota bacterium]|nr:hypothetical protein [Actinomycetota bacterium]